MLRVIVDSFMHQFFFGFIMKMNANLFRQNDDNRNNGCKNRAVNKNLENINEYRH